MLHILRIQLRKTDGVLITWHKAVTALNNRGLLSFLVKEALKQYIRTGETICIGKIFLPDTIIMDEEKYPAINLYIDDSPEIMEWKQSQKEQGRKAMSLLRDILKQSIQIVESSEQEWIPSYFDIEKMSLGFNIQTKKPEIKVPKQSVSVLNRKKEEMNFSTTKPIENKKHNSSSKSLKAAALFGKM